MNFYMKYLTLYCFVCGAFMFFVKKITNAVGYFAEGFYIDSYQPFRRISMSGEKAQAVKELIKSDNVVIFSKTYCPYCKMAKNVFDQLKKSYTAVELDNRDDGDEIQSILAEITGARTVPRVFVNGECLGGGSDVKALYEKGELLKYFEA
ncbi:hypothetical protein HHI36_015742 [Cryptolaemus montrouzieri]|uniref:Glutaredoxin-2, mitochondrial n=1 Tax=Cryptolaemus montrouzieri TaxID=559131 RepID=A0ABD2N6V5_9CUCU